MYGPRAVRRADAMCDTNRARKISSLQASVACDRRRHGMDDVADNMHTAVVFVL